MRGKSRKSKKPKQGNTDIKKIKDIGSGSDEEDVGDIFTDEINEFTEARNKVSLGPEVSESEEEEAILPLHGDNYDDESDEELADWSKRLTQLKFQNKLAKNKIKKDKPEGSWGERREDYYGAFSKKNKRRVVANDLDDWTLEEKEAEKLQSKLDEELEEGDFMPFFTPESVQKPSHKEEEKKSVLTVKQNLTQKEKRELEAKLHPEAEPLREELNNCLEELESLKGRKGWRIQSRDTCFRLLAANIAFYLHLIETNEDCRGHPVLKRIIQWKKLAKMYLEIPDEKMEASEDETSDAESNLNIPRVMPIDEEEDMSNDEVDMKETEDRKDNDPVTGRPITYQMEKNKTQKWSKKNNPRVRHRQKFKKATIRRRGQVREYRPEITKYRGETTGIRAGVKKSVRLH